MTSVGTSFNKIMGYTCKLNVLRYEKQLRQRGPVLFEEEKKFIIMRFSWIKIDIRGLSDSKCSSSFCRNKTKHEDQESYNEPCKLYELLVSIRLSLP